MRPTPPASTAPPIGCLVSLHIHHGSHLRPLVDVLADTLARPLADPFQAEVVSVPTAGMRDWLQQQLALRLGAGPHHDGISANIDMVFPGRFTAAVLGQPLDEISGWELERLSWTVLAALESKEVEVPGWRARRGGTYATARRIADLFDRYSINRPQMLQQWHAGHDGDGTEDENGGVMPLPVEQRWQPQLWRLVRTSIKQPNPAELLPDLLGDLRSGRIEPALPERVAAFGVSTVSTAQLALLRSLAAVREVHLCLMHPSPAAWAGTRQHLDGRLVPRSGCDASAAVRHPLLRSWGRPAMESAVLVAGPQGSTEQHLVQAPQLPAAAPPPPSLLAEIQAGILADVDPHERPRAADDVPATIDVHDNSLQVHACHGAVRQLEVLRDALDHLFVGDPTLTAHDVVVLCPDLPRFASLVPAVFARSALPVPVRVTDLSLGTDNPVASALVDVLGVIGGRCTGPEIVGLCSLGPVRHRFGIDDEMIQRIDHWVSELGITWGLDARHRSRWVPETLAEGTWQAGLDRLLLGAAMPAPTPRVGPSDIVPYDHVDTAALVTVGQLADVLEHVGRLNRCVTEPQPIESWVAVLTDLVECLFATASDDAWQIVQVMEAVAGIGRHASATEGGADVELALDDVRSLLTGVLSEQRGRLNLRSGAVTVTAMVPARNLPYRVVCVLGLDEGALRPPGADGDDLLGLRPCVGERDPRAEGRHLLLDALMSAGEHLLITCDGSDITTNRPLPLPVHVAELLDLAHAHRPGIEVVRRHARQAYDERNYGLGAQGQQVPPLSFDRGMLAAAERRRNPRRTVGERVVLSPVVPPPADFGCLADAITRPAKLYLGRRLDVRLPRPVEEIVTEIPLTADGMTLRSIAMELLQHHRRDGSAEDLAQWRGAKRRGGVLPPRALADFVLDEVEQDVDAFLAVRPNMRCLLAAQGAEDIDLSVATDDGSVTIRDRVAGLEGDLLVRVEYSRPKIRHRVRAALELAALVVTRPEQPWEALVVTRPKSGVKTVPTYELRPAFGSVVAARHLLDVAGSIYARALREPLPMFDASMSTLVTDATIDDELFAADLRDNEIAFVWGDTTPDEVLALPVRDDDIPALVAHAAAAGEPRRAVALARWFWDALDAFVDIGGPNQ
jgi:exodeoxyribonuclease V gamma subunit